MASRVKLLLLRFPTDKFYDEFPSFNQKVIKTYFFLCV